MVAIIDAEALAVLGVFISGPVLVVGWDPDFVEAVESARYFADLRDRSSASLDSFDFARMISSVGCW